MAVNPQYLLGRHVTGITLFAQNIAANGAITDGASVSLTNRDSGFSIDLATSMDQISPLNSRRQNNVDIEDSFTINLQELPVNNGNSPSLLKDRFQAGIPVKVVIIYGTGTSQRTDTAFGRFASCSFAHTTKGGLTCSASIVCADGGDLFFTTAS